MVSVEQFRAHSPALSRRERGQLAGCPTPGCWRCFNLHINHYRELFASSSSNSICNSKRNGVLLINENIPPASVGFLREAGHDVVAVTERSPGSSDDEVMRLARDEACIIITCDRDYGELIYRRRLPVPTGVLYLRFLPACPREPAAYPARLIAGGVEPEDKFTTRDRERIRRQPLARKQG